MLHVSRRDRRPKRSWPPPSCRDAAKTATTGVAGRRDRDRCALRCACWRSYAGTSSRVSPTNARCSCPGLTYDTIDPPNAVANCFAFPAADVERHEALEVFDPSRSATGAEATAGSRIGGAAEAAESAAVKSVVFGAVRVSRTESPGVANRRKRGRARNRAPVASRRRWGDVWSSPPPLDPSTPPDDRRVAGRGVDRPRHAKTVRGSEHEARMSESEVQAGVWTCEAPGLRSYLRASRAIRGDRHARAIVLARRPHEEDSTSRRVRHGSAEGLEKRTLVPARRDTPTQPTGISGDREGPHLDGEVCRGTGRRLGWRRRPMSPSHSPRARARPRCLSASSPAREEENRPSSSLARERHRTACRPP